MRILVVGAGSMGRRRLRDLSFLLAPGELSLFEPMAARASQTGNDFGVPYYTDFEQALDTGVDTIVVSTPPAFHDKYVRQALERRLNVFAEVPFTLNGQTLAALMSDSRSDSLVIGISRTIRYYPPFRIIHDLLAAGEVGKPLYIEYSLGNYLPDWHPYEDYRSFYGHDGRLGAGMDMILHELGAIQWWMGPIQAVQARLAKLSQLEVKGLDSHDVLLTFESARGFFHNDIIEQGTLGRHVRIAGENGTIEWHQNQPTIRLYRGAAKQNVHLEFDRAADWDEALKASRQVSALIAKWTSGSGAIPSDAQAQFSYESCYLREMRDFLAAVRQRSPFPLATPAEEYQTVRTFEAILESSEKRVEISLSERPSPPAPIQ